MYQRFVLGVGEPKFPHIPLLNMGELRFPHIPLLNMGELRFPHIPLLNMGDIGSFTHICTNLLKIISND
jgi:hypothetical protein